MPKHAYIVISPEVAAEMLDEHGGDRAAAIRAMGQLYSCTRSSAPPTSSLTPSQSQLTVL